MRALMNVDEINFIYCNRMMINLSKNASRLNGARGSVRGLFLTSFDELNIIRSNYLTVGEIGLMLFEQDVAVQAIRRRFETDLEYYLGLYLYFLHQTLEATRIATIEEQFTVWEDLVDEEVAAFMALYAGQMQDYTNFDALFTQIRGEFVDKFHQAVAVGDRQQLTKIVRQLQYRMNRTWTTAIADTTNKALDAVHTHVGVEYVMWSDFVERNLIDNSTHGVCGFCRKHSRGGRLSLGIYTRAELRNILQGSQICHVNGRCVFIPVTNQALLDRLATRQ